MGCNCGKRRAEAWELRVDGRRETYTSKARAEARRRKLGRGELVRRRPPDTRR